MGKVHKINDQKPVVQPTVITTVKENHSFYGAWVWITHIKQ